MFGLNTKVSKQRKMKVTVHSSRSSSNPAGLLNVIVLKKLSEIGTLREALRNALSLS